MRTPTDRASLWLRPGMARVLAVVWVAVVVLVYFVRYDAWMVPLQAATLLAAAAGSLSIGRYFHAFLHTAGAGMAFVVAISATAFAVGVVLIGRLVPRRDLLGALMVSGAGLWFIAVGVLVVGMFDITKVRWIFLTASCWLLPAPRKFVGGFFVSTEKIDGWARLMLVCIVVAAIITLPGVWAPPFEYDELEYHLGVPAEYLRTGRIVFLPHNFYSNMPQLTEMLYTLAIATTSDVAAKLMHWAFGLLSAMGVFAVAQRLWSRQVGLTAAALFYCVPFVRDLGQTARVDLATTFYAVLSFGALLLWLKDDEEQQYFWLSALTMGGIVATKWTAIGLCLLPAVVLILLTRPRNSKLVLRLAGYVALAAVPVIPWALKNWWLAGNPVYPMLPNIFPSAHWSQWQVGLFARRHYGSFDVNGWKELVTRISGFSFEEDGSVPLLLMVAPLVLLVRRPDKTARQAAGLFLLVYVSWFFLTYRPWRFLFPAFPLAAMAGAYALEQMGSRRILRLIVGAALAVSVLSVGLLTLVDTEKIGRVPTQMSFLQYALGQVSREEFIARMGNGVFECEVWMNRNLPKDAKVLYVGEARAYYATNPVVWSTAYDQHPLTTMSRAANTPEELLAGLREQGITHVYVNFSELDRLRTGYGHLNDANWTLIRHLLQSEAKEIHRFGRGVVYEL